MGPRRRPTNRDIASQLLETANVLQADGADKWRVRAYREAARTVFQIKEPIAGILERDGRQGLIALPAIGEAIAKRIEEMVYVRHTESGQISIFDDPVDAPPPPRPTPAEATGDLFEAARVGGDRPTVALLLHVDRRFREHVDASERADRTSGEWLPTWQVEKGGWHFTVRFSSTRAAHRAGRTHDWVVIDYAAAGTHDQITVVTEYRGPMNGRRVVRGRERESLRFWAEQMRRKLERQRRFG